MRGRQGLHLHRLLDWRGLLHLRGQLNRRGLLDCCGLLLLVARVFFLRGRQGLHLHRLLDWRGLLHLRGQLNRRGFLNRCRLLRLPLVLRAHLVHHGLHLARIHCSGRSSGASQALGLGMVVLFDLFALGRGGHAGPPGIDFWCVDLLGDHGRGKAGLGRFHLGGVEEELGADPAGEFAAMVLRPVAVALAHKLQHLNAVLGALGDPPVVQAAVEDEAAWAVPGNDRDVGDVHRAVDDGDIPLARNQDIAQHRRAEIAVFAEGIGQGANVVVAIHPYADARLRLKDRIGRQRRPADVIIALAPGDPCRAPFVIRLPDPAVIFQANPAAIMVGDGAEILVGNPCPSRIRVAPVAVGVGTPIAIHPPRLPAIAVRIHIHPAPVGRKAFVKIRERDARLGLPGQDGAKQNGQHEGEQEVFYFHQKRGC